ncbi:MAG: hypothetical protein R3F48_08025 [Candidatus Zixiibacteriota bacterium]
MKKSDNKKDSDFEDDSGDQSPWVVVAETQNRTEAEFAVNGLQSYDIPAVLDASPGVLGTAGLPLQSIYKNKAETFKVKVPAEYEEEASDLVNMFLSEGGTEDFDEDVDDDDDDDEEYDEDDFEDDYSDNGYRDKKGKYEEEDDDYEDDDYDDDGYGDEEEDDRY